MTDECVRDTYRNPLFCRLCGHALTIANHGAVKSKVGSMFHGLCVLCMPRYREQMGKQRSLRGYVEIGKALDGTALYKRVKP